VSEGQVKLKLLSIMEYEHEELNKPALNMRESLKDVSIVHVT
jgi:hypothetical protein